MRAPMDDLGLEQPVDRFGQRVVIGIPDAADRGLDACFRKALNVAYGKILRPPVGVMYEARAPCRSALMDGLLQV